MLNQKFPLPKRYTFYIVSIIVLSILLFLDIFIVTKYTGGRELYEFTAQDWPWLIRGVLSGAVVSVLLYYFACLAGKLATQQQEQLQTYLAQFRYAGISPDDYDFLWIHFSGLTRAIIRKSDGCFHLRFEEFNCKAEQWEAVPGGSVYPSMLDLKRALFYDFDFCCKENAAFDKHGEEIFKDDPS